MILGGTLELNHGISIKFVQQNEILEILFFSRFHILMNAQKILIDVRQTIINNLHLGP